MTGTPGWASAQAAVAGSSVSSQGVLAVSSRGLGHGPLKAGTRVRIPLPLLRSPDVGLIVYRLGRHPFKVQRRVRLPLGLCRTRRGVQALQSARDTLQVLQEGQEVRWCWLGCSYPV